MDVGTRRGPGRPPRLAGFDYRSFGDYFVTICTADRECVFGSVEEGVVHLSSAGLAVEAAWLDLPRRFPFMRLDEHVVMPNHFHGVLGYWPSEEQEATEGVRQGDPVHVGLVVRAFKSLSAVAANRVLGRRGRPLWQRGYFEHVVRSDRALEAIQHYIRRNPEAWARDRHNPSVFARGGRGRLGSAST